MTNSMIPATFQGGAVSTKFAGKTGNELGANIRSGFGVLAYKGKVWSTKFQGVEKQLLREDGDGARASIEVIIVKAAEPISKIYYEKGFVDGSNAPPDCWSTNGVTPDGASPKKQSTTCAGCPQNAWGSKVTEQGKQAKNCADSKRLAVVPLNDPRNELMGGAMLLRVPAASLKDLKAYGDQLQAYGYPYFAVATRIAFDTQEAYPKFVFSAMRPLTDAEAEIVLELQDSAQTKTILNESVEHVNHEPVKEVPVSPFENKAPTPTTVTTPVPQVQAQAQQPVQPVANPPAEATTPAAEPVKRKRRTKAEMEAAAAALKAGREVPAPAQTQAPQPTPAPQPEAESSAPGDFDAKLDALLQM